jgi:hypothetical protein
MPRVASVNFPVTGAEGRNGKVAMGGKTAEVAERRRPHFAGRAGRVCFAIMTKLSRNSEGKVEQEGRALGVPTKTDIERRALELARIDGRTQVTPDDCLRARRELSNADLPPTVNEDAESMQSLSRDPSDPAVDRGRQAPEYTEIDQQQVVQRLALEGVEEAQHEQMVQARAIDSPRQSREARR